MNGALESTIARIAPDIVSLRHDLHQHPEIRFEEHWTSDRIARFLDEIGVAYQRGFAKGTGIVATINGDGPGTVALRADIDALEIEEQTGLPYASRIPGRMHACGHDGHSAILCGVIQTLNENAELLQGSVRFLFQPAEELAAGGKYMVEDGAIDGVDAVFGLHGWPTLPLGVVGVRDGCMMASAQDFRIEIRGKGCHGADPAAGIDPIVIAAHITTALQSVVARETNPWDSAVVTVGEIHGGTVTNIIPETALLKGTLRSLNEAQAERLRRSIARIAEHTALAHRASADVSFTQVTYPPVVNDPAMTDLARAAIVEVLGPDALYEAPHPYMGAEDFSYYQQRVPGSYLWLGVNPHPGTPYPFLHNPQYDFTDDAVPIGMRVLTDVAVRFLAQAAGQEAATVHA